MQGDKKLVIGSDHAGYTLKARLVEYLTDTGFSLIDVGCDSSTHRVDYPSISESVINAMTEASIERAVICCGSGIGVSIAANRFNGIRAVVAYDPFTAKMSRHHNDTNVLCLGGRFTAPELAFEILQTWLDTPFDGGRHADRVRMMDEFQQDAFEQSLSNREGHPTC